MNQMPPPPALRTLAEIRAAGAAYGASMPPLTDAQADKVAALLAPYWPAPAASRGPRQRRRGGVLMAARPAAAR